MFCSETRKIVDLGHFEGQTGFESESLISDEASSPPTFVAVKIFFTTMKSGTCALKLSEALRVVFYICALLTVLWWLRGGRVLATDLGPGFDSLLFLL